MRMLRPAVIARLRLELERHWISKGLMASSEKERIYRLEAVLRLIRETAYPPEGSRVHGTVVGPLMRIRALCDEALKACA